MSETITGEVVLMDDEVKSTLDSLDTPSNEIAISQMLDKAKSYLEVAMRQADAPRAIADFKAEIIAVAQYAKQKRVSEEIQIDATAMVRRAERSLGVAIREGQERGEISTVSSGAAVAAQNREARKRGEQESTMRNFLPNASEYLPAGQGTVDSYAMADDVTDSEFDAALDAAKEEKNLSRANVVRKIKEAKGEVEPKPPKIPKQPKLNTEKTMERLTDSLWGVRQSLQTITAVDAELDQDQVSAWIKELSSTTNELNRIKNLLKGSI